jgi:hypothetical protein
MPEHAEREGVRAPVVPLEQRTKRVAVTFARGFNQLAVIDWVTSGGRSLALLIHAASVISPWSRLSDGVASAMLRTAGR